MTEGQKQPCPGCGAPVPATAEACPACGKEIAAPAAAAPVAPPSPPPVPVAAAPAAAAPPAPEGDATGGIIPYKNAYALIAYYCGVFSLLSIIPLFFPLPVLALIFGIKGLRARNRNPVIKGSVHAWIGIILGGVFTLISGALLVLLLFALAQK